MGAQEEILKFTKNLDSTNHVAVNGERDTIDVRVTTLDELLNKEHPALIKIDVEGFETEVLNGAEEVLKSRELKALIIELNGSGKRYGYEDSLIHSRLLDYGFKPYEYNPMNRQLIEMKSYGKENTLYVRDIAYVKDRVKNARRIMIGSNEKYI